MKSRTENAKRNIISGLFFKLISTLLPFITRTCIIYILGTTYLGLNSLFTSVLQILSLAELGFGEAMVFSMYKPLAAKDDIKVCALLNLYKKIYNIIGFLMLIVGLSIIPFLRYFIKGGTPENINVILLYIIYLFNTIISYWLFAYKTSLFAAMQEQSINNNISVFIQTITSILQIIILLIFKNYYIYAIVIPITTIIRNCITEYVSRKKYPQYYCVGNLNKNEINEIKKRVTGLFIYKISGTFRNSFDSIVISAFLGLVMLGKYENYYFIMSTIIGILTIISSSLTAGIGNSIATESVEKNYKDFNKFFFLYEYITGWCTICLFCLYQPFVKLWVGKDLMLSNTIIILMCLYFYIIKTCDMSYVYRNAIGLWWKDKFRPAIEAIANLILNIVLVKYFGVAGVILSTILTMFFLNYFWGIKILFENYFKNGLNDYFRKTLFYFINMVIALIITYGIIYFINIDGFVGLFIKGIICVVVPNIILFLVYKNNEYYQYGINLIKKQLKRNN